MARPASALLVSVTTILLVACGGSPPLAKAPKQAAKPDISIGDTALAQGGLLGGNGADQGLSVSTPGTLRADLVTKDSPVKLDGTLQEWPGRTPARLVVKGAPGDKLAFGIAIQYDEKNLYVGAEVKDDTFVRTERFAEGEDHASLVLAFPSAGSLAAYEIGLFAGKPGETTGQVRLGAGGRRGEIPGAKIVEAPTGNGYTFEASIPWSTFPEARLLRVGLRASARYYDSEGSASARSVIATSAGDASSPASLPPLLSEAEQAVVEGLLTEKGLTGQAPRIDLYADVAGDAMKERISVWGQFITVLGPGYRGGKEYFFRDLAAEPIRLEARDLTGRGKADLVLRRRFSAQGGTRDWFEVWSFLAGDEPTTTFAHEIVVAREGKHVANSVHVAGRDVEVGVEPPTGWDPGTYREPTAIDVEPILLPWGAVRSQSFRFDGSHFAKTREVKQTPAAGAAPEAPAPQLPRDLPTPPQQAGGDLSKQVFEQYKRDHGVTPETQPKIDLRVQVDGDARPERVVLVGRDIVVFGPGFKGGTQYAVITLQQFADPTDIRDLTARDLTGDGAADLVVRGIRHVTPAGGGDSVDVEATFVYQVKGSTLTRIFAIETAREQGTKRVQGLVQFVPSKDKGFDIDVRPGRATGWSERTYPWSQDQPGSSAVEPLLLPWGKIPSLRYSFNGTQYAR